MMTDQEPPSQLEPDCPRALHRARLLVVVLMFGLLSTSGWVVWKLYQSGRFDGRGGLSRFLEVHGDVPSGGRFRGDPYIGTAACSLCHPGESALYSSSGHARTFRPASERRLTDQLAGQSVADPELPGVRWTFHERDGRFLIDRQNEGQIRQFVVDYALGSGHHATTFVTVLDLDAPRLLEHRLTFYAKDGSLEITPGHARRKDKSGASEEGIELDSFLSLKCLGCHATQLSSTGNSGFDPRSLIPNVTCERCHGPARDHVEAANRGANG
jgi:hypothetical protein